MAVESRVARVVFFVVMMLAGAACQRSPSNLLLVTFDTTRWDHMGYASGREGTTPTLDALAARGAWFESAVSSQPLTLPSHASILTGLYPTHHRVRNNGTYTLNDDVVTLAEVLRDAGYQTHAVISALVLDGRFGLDQGFEVYEDDLGEGSKADILAMPESKADRTADKAGAWLEAAVSSDRPFFLWIHFFDPHATYNPPPDVAARFPDDRYAGEIFFADRELGRVIGTLESLGVGENTLVAFTADHGEGLGDHGEETHGLFVYESTTRVPLLFAGPGVPAAGRVGGLARTVDIMPTVLSVLGVSLPVEVDGRSLLPMIRGDLDQSPALAYLETFHPRENFGWSELRSLRGERYKAILAPRPELYDLHEDPEEEHNLLSSPEQSNGISAELLGRLEEIAHVDAAGRDEAGRQDLDADLRERLAQLGYLWQNVKPEETEDRADPKDRVEFWDRAHAAQLAIADGRVEEAVEIMRSYLARDPSSTTAKTILAMALEMSGAREEALEIFLEIVEQTPRWAPPYFRAALILTSMGRISEAKRLLEEVGRIQPTNPDSFYQLGKMELRAGNVGEAEKLFQKALDVDPGHEYATVGLALCLEKEGSPHRALAVLSAARRQFPESRFLTSSLGDLYDRTGDLRSAVELYQSAVRDDPEDATSWNRLGGLYLRMGLRQQAVESVTRAHELDPSDLSVTFNLAKLLLAADQAAAAVPLLERVSAGRPDMAAAQVMLFRALEVSQGRSRADSYLARLSSERPSVAMQVARAEVQERGAASGMSALATVLENGGAAARNAAESDPVLAPLVAAASR